MDEPLASLDERGAAEILPYIERLRDIGVPILYVSHSVAEVARLATTVVILTEGKVTAVGPVLDILPLADASDGGSVLDAVVADHDETFQLTRLTSPRGRAAGAAAHRAPRARPCAPISARATSCCRCSRRRRSARSTCWPARWSQIAAQRRAGRRAARLQRRHPGRPPHRQVGAAARAGARAGRCSP